MNSMNILPPEMWEGVFAHAEENPQDWLNLYRASSSFQDIFRDQRKLVLFQDVLPHVAKHLERRGGDVGGDLLRLRLVCGAWKQGVDTMIGKECLKVSQYPSDLCKNYRFHWVPDTLRFLQAFESRKGMTTKTTTPFIGNYVSVKYPHPTDDTMEEYEACVDLLLTKFGRHVKRLYITDICLSNRIPNLLHRLAGSIAKTPNLERLDVDILSSSWDFHLLPKGSIKYQIETHFANHHPLPAAALKKLKCLTIGGQGGFLKCGGEVFQNEMLKAYADPKLLRGAAVQNIPSELSNMSRLKQLTINLVWNRNLELSILGGGGGGGGSLPLKELILTSSDQDNKSFDIGDIFASAEQFKESLTSLRVHLKLRVHPQLDAHLKLNLPHLKLLEISGISSLDYFTSLSKLQELHVSNWESREGYNSSSGPDEIMKTFGMENKMGSSNIWTVLPKLKSLKFQGIRMATVGGMLPQPFRFDKVYSREDYYHDQVVNATEAESTRSSSSGRLSRNNNFNGTINMMIMTFRRNWRASLGEI